MLGDKILSHVKKVFSSCSIAVTLDLASKLFALLEFFSHTEDSFTVTLYNLMTSVFIDMYEDQTVRDHFMSNFVDISMIRQTTYLE